MQCVYLIKIFSLTYKLSWSIICVIKCLLCCTDIQIPQNWNQTNGPNKRRQRTKQPQNVYESQQISATSECEEISCRVQIVTDEAIVDEAAILKCH